MIQKSSITQKRLLSVQLPLYCYSFIDYAKKDPSHVDHAISKEKYKLLNRIKKKNTTLLL